MELANSGAGLPVGSAGPRCQSISIQKIKYLVNIEVSRKQFLNPRRSSQWDRKGENGGSGMHHQGLLLLTQAELGSPISDLTTE